MLFRDDYIKMLEKRASDFDGGKIGPTFDHDVDSASAATAEHKKNLNENRETLGGLFTNFGSAQKAETAFANKWSPTKLPEDTSSPLIKVAMDALSGSSAFQAYPAHYKVAAVRGFVDELEKIAAGNFLKGLALHTGLMAGGLTGAAGATGQLGNLAHQAVHMPGQIAQAAKSQGVLKSLASGVQHSAHAVPPGANPFMQKL